MKERIEELARELEKQEKDYKGVMLAAFYEVYNEALEMAAKECEARKDSWLEFGYTHDSERVAESFRCAEAIRKLKCS